MCTLGATPRIVLISKTDSGKSRWEWPGENEGNLRLHAHLGMVAGDGERNSKAGEEREKHIKSQVGGNAVVCESRVSLSVPALWNSLHPAVCLTEGLLSAIYHRAASQRTAPVAS